MYYIQDEFDVNIPTIVLKSNTDDITKQLYYQIIYLENKLVKQDEIMLFINYSDKFIIGIDKNKKLKIKNYSLVENDIDIVHMEQRRQLDTYTKEENIDENELEFGWNERYDFFFEKLSVLIHNEENIYNKISQFNKWKEIFPSDDQLNKVKLNDELIERIFTEYHFKDLKKDSTPKAIVKNIYNTFFNKHVIKSKTNDKKNYSLYIDDNTHRMYEYGINSLKRYQKLEELNINDIFNDE
jgi:hypothetical protein